MPLNKAIGDRAAEAFTFENIGEAYQELGESQKALDYYGEALPLVRASGDRNDEAFILNNIGTVYKDLGERQKALDYLGQALPLYHALGAASDEATALNNMGTVYDVLGEKQKALDCFGKALPLFRAVGNQVGEATTLSNMGALYQSLGEQPKALDFYGQALPLRRAVNDRAGESVTLYNIGRVYSYLGESKTALDHFGQALSLSRAVGDRSNEALQLNWIAHVYRDTGDLTEARTLSDASLRIIESLRTKVTSQDLRAAYFATVRGYYEFNIDVLMRLHKQRPLDGFDGAALKANELARARSLLELLNEAHADIRQGVDPSLLERERRLQQLLDDKAELRVRLLSGPHTDEQAKSIAKEIESLTTGYQEIESKIRQSSPHYAALTQPEPLPLKAMQQELDPSTLLLEYSLGEERSYLWLVSSTQIKSFQLPPRKEIETAARKYYELLTVVTDARHKETAEVSLRLSRLLLGPIASQLGQNRLVIVADGALQYLPFAALPDLSSNKAATEVAPLMIQHEIISLPSISVLALLRSELAGRKPASKQLAVLADPVFDSEDKRVKNNAKTRSSAARKLDSAENGNSSGGAEKAFGKAMREETRFSRLLSTRNEAEGIIGLVPLNRRTMALDFAASRELVSSGELSQYRYVHFATHSLVDSVHPELTAIVLSLVSRDGNPQNGFLRAHEIYNLNLPADIVVLSACETALGKDVKGEGLIGLTRGFMYAGAARVVASLWSVRDESTAQLMLSFYRGMIKERKRPAEALRAAQIKMLRSGRWSAPHYWAPFVLQGEWR
jgi:CHAT domain-containing protein/Tfp pilus assembly protein PilF